MDDKHTLKPGCGKEILSMSLTEGLGQGQQGQMTYTIWHIWAEELWAFAFQEGTGQEVGPGGFQLFMLLWRERWTALPGEMVLLSQSPYCLGNNLSDGSRAQQGRQGIQGEKSPFQNFRRSLRTNRNSICDG